MTVMTIGAIATGLVRNANAVEVESALANGTVGKGVETATETRETDIGMKEIATERETETTETETGSAKEIQIAIASGTENGNENGTRT